MLGRNGSMWATVALVAVISVGVAGLAACSGDMKKQDDMSMKHGSSMKDGMSMKKDASMKHDTSMKGGCPTCAALMASDAGGWCDHCGVGHYKGQTTECKGCLEAMQTDGTCPRCGITYEDGKKVEP